MRSRRAGEPIARSQNAAPRAALRENMVNNAVAFLNNPSVRSSSSDKQVASSTLLPRFASDPILR